MDFNYISDNNYGLTTSTVIGVFIGAFIGIVVVTIVLVLATKNSENNWVNKKFSILIIFVIALIPAALGGIILSLMFPASPTEKTKEQKIIELQHWATEKYLLNITPEQAEKLMSDQTSEEDQQNEYRNKITPTTVTDAYGNKQKITLIKTSNTTWEILNINYMKPVETKPENNDGKQK